jgi:hypothetical protein
MKKTIMIIAACLLFAAPAFSTQEDLDTFISSGEYLLGSYAKIVDFFSQEVSKQIAFNGTAGMDLSANVCAWPGVSLGLIAGLSMGDFNVEGFKTLDVDYIEIEEVASSLPKILPLPAGVFYIKTGVPFFPVKSDFGIKFLPFSYTLPDTGNGGSILIKDYIFGVEARFQLIEDSPATPMGLVVSGSMDFMSGRVEVKSAPQATSNDVEINGTDYISDIDGSIVMGLDWAVQSYGIKAIINKNLLFISPFFGLGINANYGAVNGKVGAQGEVTLTDKDNALDVTTGPLDTYVMGSAAPRMLDFKLISGFDLTFIPATKIGIAYEWGGNVYSLTAGLKIQIP